MLGSEHVNFEFVKLAGLFDAVLHQVSSQYQVPATSMDLMKFPGELRANIIEHYLLAEVRTGTMGKSLHYDDFGSECCVWNWPDELVICDKAKKEDLPHLVFPKWLPNLALTNHQLHGEVVVHMLKTTKQSVLKYDDTMPVKIAPWFLEFLESFPGTTGTEGLDAVQDINFPHIHWYNHDGSIPANDTNKDIDLMLKCPNLKRVGMTFHAYRINSTTVVPEAFPLPLDNFLDRFRLRPMLGCNQLKHVYIGGIEHFLFLVVGNDQLKTLRDFGKWLRKSFKEKGQDVTVSLHARNGRFRGWGDGEPL